MPLPLEVTGDFKALSCSSCILCEDGEEDDDDVEVIVPEAAPATPAPESAAA